MIPYSIVTVIITRIGYIDYNTTSLHSPYHSAVLALLAYTDMQAYIHTLLFTCIGLHTYVGLTHRNTVYVINRGHNTAKHKTANHKAATASK